MSDLLLDWTDRDSTKEVRVGDRIRVSLLEHGTTGYFWTPEHQRDDAIEVIEEHDLKEDGRDAAPEVLGTGSMREISFRGLRPGTSNLVIRYTRGVKADSDLTYQVTIKVTDSRGPQSGDGGAIHDD